MQAQRRQPVHVVYGGAQLFKADTAPRLGAKARDAMAVHAKDPAAFARALGLVARDPARQEALAATVFARVQDKLAREPVEDFRVDFEDGFGHRPDAEEDAAAERAAREVVAGMRAGSLPPFIGIRIKALGGATRARAVRTLDAFVTALAAAGGGRLPDGFLVTVPKVETPAEVTDACALLTELESRHGLPAGSFRLEIMIETPRALFGDDGRMGLPLLAAAGGARLVAAHFGAYDYTSSVGIAASEQALHHPACDFARQMMLAGLAGRGIFLSDGATTVMPIGDEAVVHRAWRICHANVRRSLAQGFYQGWDLHPAQLPARFAAVYGFFLEGLDDATRRLTQLVGAAGQASRVGDAFDDAATGLGLLNFFLRGVACGALTEAEAAATGLSTAGMEAVIHKRSSFAGGGSV